jgi:hypothetical protein
VFLLVNGFYFYPVLSERRQWVWLKRLLFLYIFWMAFYLYVWLKPQPVTAGYAGNLLLTLFFGYFHLWYVAGLIGAVLLVCAIARLPLKVSVPLAAVLFVVGVAIQYAGAYYLLGHGHAGGVLNYSQTHRNFLFFCFPFVYAGYLINRHQLHVRVPLKVVVPLVVIGVALLLLESYVHYVVPGRRGGIDNYASLAVVCPAVLLLFLKTRRQGLTKDLALYSSGIYFVHVWFLVLFTGIAGLANIGATAMTLLVACASVVGSFFLIKANRRVGFML